MLQAKDLKKTYSTKGGVEVHALDGVSIDFPEKGMVFLLGKSGSGKSTLLNVLGGLDRVDSGEIIIKGRNSKDFSAADFDSYRNTFIGFIFQEYNILNEFNIEQNISLALQLQGKPNDKKIVEEYLEKVDLAGLGKRKPNTLSGGQKQRVAIARALIKNPEIIMADEPTGALDSNTGKQVFDTLKKLSKEKLIIVVSHDRDFAEIYGDRIVELADGKIISDVTKHYATPKNISDNVNIVNDHTFAIKDVSKLTKEEFTSLYEVIKKGKGEALFTSGSHDIPLVRQAIRIKDDNSTEVFNDTEKVEVQEYDGKDTKFIRSHLPAPRAFKMGASSLKTKPVRMVFSIFLTSVALVMFGVASTLLFFDKNNTLTETLQKSGQTHETLRKSITAKEKYTDYNWITNKSSSYSYDRGETVYFSQADIDRLNKNGVGLNFAGLYTLRHEDAPIDNINYRYSPYFQSFAKIDTESFINKSGFSFVAGGYSDGPKDIMITIHQFNALRGYFEIPVEEGEDINQKYAQVIGKTFPMKLEKVDYTNWEDHLITENFVIKGVVDVGKYPSRFDSLFKDGGSTNPNLYEKFNRYLTNSFHTAFFTGPSFFEAHKNYLMHRSFNPQRSESHEYYANNLNIYNGGMNSVADENAAKNMDPNFECYDLNGNKKEYVAPTGENIYLNYNYSAQVFNNDSNYDAIQNIRNILEVLRNDYGYGIGIVVSKNEQELLEKIYSEISYFYCSIDQFIESLDYVANKYYSPFYEMNNINRFLDNFDTMWDIRSKADSYESISDFATLRSINNTRKESQNYKVTLEQFEQIKTILNTDTFLQHWTKYFTCCEHYFDDISDAYQNGQVVDSTKLQNAINSIQSEIESEKYRPQTYTFEYDLVKANKIGYDVYTPSGSKNGKFTIKGFFKPQEANSPLNSVNYIIGSDFIRSNNIELRLRQSVTEQTSDYQYSEEDVFVGAITATKYTKEQVKFLSSTSYNHASFKITNPESEMVQLMLSQIDLYKKIFLYIGLGFAVFASLMLLNFISSSIASKAKEIGILRAVGARGSDLFKIFFSESGIVSLICVAIGIGGSIPLISYLNKTLSQSLGMTLLAFGPINIGVIIGLAIVIAFIGTFIPVLIASKKPPVESIRSM